VARERIRPSQRILLGGRRRLGHDRTARLVSAAPAGGVGGRGLGHRWSGCRSESGGRRDGLSWVLSGRIRAPAALVGTVLLGTALLGTVLLGTVLLGTVLLGTVLLGTALLGTVLLRTVLPGTVLLGTVLPAPPFVAPELLPPGILTTGPVAAGARRTQVLPHRLLLPVAPARRLGPVPVVKPGTIGTVKVVGGLSQTAAATRSRGVHWQLRGGRGHRDPGRYWHRLLGRTQVARPQTRVVVCRDAAEDLIPPDHDTDDEQ
jgi:hypothetical protein